MSERASKERKGADIFIISSRIKGQFLTLTLT